MSGGSKNINASSPQYKDIAAKISSGQVSGQLQDPQVQPAAPINLNTPAVNAPAFLGNSQQMLADQLAAGGYGSSPLLFSQLGDTFKAGTKAAQAVQQYQPPPAAAGGGFDLSALNTPYLRSLADAMLHPTPAIGVDKANAIQRLMMMPGAQVSGNPFAPAALPKPGQGASEIDQLLYKLAQGSQSSNAAPAQRRQGNAVGAYGGGGGPGSPSRGGYGSSR